MAKLIVISGKERQEFQLDTFNSIGRHPNNTIQILDRILSKEHAEVHRTDSGQFMLRDLGSLNGTYIGEDRVGDRVLKEGDEISMGGTRLLYTEGRKNPTQEALAKVTIAPGLTQSHIKQKITASDSDFLSEKNIINEKALRRDYERLRIGHELARSVGSELDLEKLLSKILDKAFELVGADRGAILLMNSDGELVPRYHKNRSGNASDEIVLSRTVMAEVVSNKAAVLSSDATMDSRFSGAQSVIMQGIRSTMTVPLLHRDEILGVMHLDSQIATNAFTEKDLQICAGMASQAAISIQNARLATRIEHETATRAQISRLVPPSVVEQVLAGDLVIEPGGRLAEITMLYSDIRGFTSMSEGSQPADIVNTLNEYFEVMVEVLFQYQGTLDKFVGDEIIGLFGAPIEIEDSIYKAVVCGIKMLEALAEFNRTRQAENLPPIRIGIGINTGEVVTGMVGSSKSLQYTAIGDAMNVAARLVGQAKSGEIIISDVTYARVKDRIEAMPLPAVKVKGKAEPLQIFRVIGIR